MTDTFERRSIDDANPEEWDMLRQTNQATQLPLDKNVQAVLEKYKYRAKLGKEKYGVTTERTDVSFLGWITHLQEELMDAVIYCERIKRELA